MARDMYGPMTGSSAWMMTTQWDLGHLLLLFAMWAVMMIGMMLPTAAPALLIYGFVVRRSPAAPRATTHIHAFAAGYVVVWTLFSLVATVLQRVFAQTLLLSPMMESQDRIFGAAILLLAGAYQFSPWKNACLAACRAPAEFLTRHWRPGVKGGFRLGVINGLYCLGCCWAMMLLLFVGGVMNLWWIAGLTVLVLVEKVAPFGVHSGRISGGVMMAAGLWTLFAGR